MIMRILCTSLLCLVVPSTAVSSCFSDQYCDDELWCNGKEVCISGECVPGYPPCDPAYTICSENLNSCLPTHCCGDFDSDGDVDGEDLMEFLDDFGRGQYNKPCG